MSSARGLFELPVVALGLTLVGVTLGLVGAAIARDYRGFTTWHVDRSFAIMAKIRGHSTHREQASRRRRQLALERGIGWAFLCFGAMLAVIGIVGLVGWAVT